MEALTRPTTCDRCGKPFNTSDQHPSRYCSISCEEGRSALPVSDPSSEGYHRYLQGEPEALVGKEVLAVGLKQTDYSPEWHKSPEQYSPRRIVSHNESDTTLVVKDEVFLGTVVSFENGQYTLKHEDIESGEGTERTVNASTAVSQIRQDTWWVA